MKHKEPITAECSECGEPLLIETILHDTDGVVIYVNPCENCLQRVFEQEYKETLSDRENRLNEHR